MSPPHFETVTVIGVGLLGGSLGLALKNRGLAKHVIGIGHRDSTLDTAMTVGAIDEKSKDLSDRAAHADLIVIATPAGSAIKYLDALRDRIRPESVVTDVVSTKAELSAHARKTWPLPCRYVGSHPMAGSEKWGPENADADLYQDAVTFVEVGDHLDAGAREIVVSLWQSLGCRVADIGAGDHDQLLAATSHLPHIVASALAQGLPHSDAILDAVGPGFRDTTRVADGRPELWRDICLANGQAIGTSLEQLLTTLNTLRTALAAHDANTLQTFFEQGRDARRRALGE